MDRPRARPFRVRNRQDLVTIDEPKCQGARSINMTVSLLRCVGASNLAGSS
jgi:hypothetical protein